jgi:uncharacterized protein YlaI
MINQISVSSKIYDSIFRAKETMNSEYEDALDWITDIKENPNRPKRNECEICDSNKKLEQHHVRGNKHGNETITLCHDCHEILTNKQKLWDRPWLDPNAENKDQFLIRGLIDICELKYDKTSQEIFKLFAEELTRGFSYE